MASELGPSSEIEELECPALQRHQPAQERGPRLHPCDAGGEPGCALAGQRIPKVLLEGV